MHFVPETIRAVWPDQSIIMSVIIGAVGAALPTDTESKAVRRVLLTCPDNVGVSFTLSTGTTVALADADEGIAFQRVQGYMIVEVFGFSHINTWGDGAGKLHVTPLVD